MNSHKLLHGYSDCFIFLRERLKDCVGLRRDSENACHTKDRITHSSSLTWNVHNKTEVEVKRSYDKKSYFLQVCPYGKWEEFAFEVLPLLLQNVRKMAASYSQNDTMKTCNCATRDTLSAVKKKLRFKYFLFVFQIHHIFKGFLFCCGWSPTIFVKAETV